MSGSFALTLLDDHVEAIDFYHEVYRIDIATGRWTGK
jgi:hypothetical protein